MVKKEIIEKINKNAHKTNNIRNICVIAHVDHGKSTLTDSLIQAAGLIRKSAAGNALFMSTREDEQMRTITIKSSGVTLPFDFAKPEKKAVDPDWKAKKAARLQAKAAAAAEGKLDTKQDEASAAAMAMRPLTRDIDVKLGKVKLVNDTYIVNLIDSPGHVDFSSEVTAALRLSDGAVVVVDSVEGTRVQTQTVLRQALQERVKPVLFLNKLDRLFLELGVDGSSEKCEELYQRLVRVIENVNAIIGTYEDEQLGDVSVHPEAGSVGFGSGLQCWGFSLSMFADMYHNMLGMSKKKLMKKLWGDNFYDPKKRKFVKSDTDSEGNKLDRGFVKFILKPLGKLFAAVKAKKYSIVEQIKNEFGIKVDSQDDESKEKTDKEMLKSIMRNWLPAADALVEMIVTHLPSPVVAQPYRVGNLYAGPLDDECAMAIRRCDPAGPLMIFVTKMVPTSDSTHFFSFGRIFCGVVKSGQSVRIQVPEYIPGDADSKGVTVKPIQGVNLMMGPYVENMTSLPCGMLVGLVGVDNYLTKTGTLTTHTKAHNFFPMKYAVSPVVRVAVSTERAADRPKLQQGLRRLVKSDGLVTVSFSETGENIIAGCGDLHLQVCLKDLEEDFMKGVPLKKSPPTVPFRESISAQSEMVCIGKSPNKHNHIKITARPLGEKFCAGVDSGDIIGDMKASDIDSKKSQIEKLIKDYGWNRDEAKRIWSFGLPGDGEANVLIDATKSVAYLSDVKETLISAFQQFTMEGVFAAEPMRGVRIEIVDVKLHQDPRHRNPGQLYPMMRDAMYAAQLASKPILLEPVFMCEISVPRGSTKQGVYLSLRARRGVVVADEDVPPDMCSVKAHLPVVESFGFADLLLKNTTGHALAQTVFSHWQDINGFKNFTIDQAQSDSFKYISQVRARKNISTAWPKVGDYHAAELSSGQSGKK